MLELMKNQLNRIYLQVGLEEENSVVDFNNLSTDFITWSSDKIYKNDLEYVSASSLLARIEELENTLKDEESSFDRKILKIQINTLKDLIK